MRFARRSICTALPKATFRVNMAAYDSLGKLQNLKGYLITR